MKREGGADGGREGKERDREDGRKRGGQITMNIHEWTSYSPKSLNINFTRKNL